MAEILSRLVGHRETLKPLLVAQARGRLASALLFAGPSGIGKRLAATALAQAMVCEKNGETACGECGSCVRVEKGQSESVLIVEPDGVAIKTEQARDILKFIALQKLARSRVVIIDQAHLLNPQAGNSLLKSLEEPPAGTHFVLLTSLAAAILPTIRSRSQMVRFRPLSIAELKQVLGPEVDDWLAEAARGSVEAASQMLEERESFLQLEQATRSFVTAAVARFPNEEISQLRELMKEKTAPGYVATLVQSLLRDAMLNANSMAPTAGKSRARKWPELAELASQWPETTLSRLAELSFGMERDFAANVDRGLILENFAIQLRHANQGLS